MVKNQNLNMSERDPFMEALVYVANHLKTTAKTQIPGFIEMWNERFSEFSIKPVLFVPFEMDKELFQKDINYRISVLEKINEAQKITFQLISDSMVLIFNEYFGSEQLVKDFPDPQDQVNVCFKIAEMYLGSLAEAVYISQQQIPMGYVFFSHQYYNLKKGITLEAIKNNISKSRLKLSDEQIFEILGGLQQMGVLEIIEEQGVQKYKLQRDISLTPAGESVFNEKFKLFIEKAMGLYRTMFDIRTLDTKIPETYPMRAYIAETVKHAATQGYTNAVQVVYYLIQYYTKVKGQ
jgi:hypothetical protein